MRDDPLIGLIAVFVPFSLISIGGGVSVISGIESDVVNARGWITSSEFIQLFAISRAAPGPGTMLATLIGWKVAGWMGAIVASLALFVPSSLLCYGVFRISNAHREKRWHRAMREGLAPVGTGLIIASAISIFRLSGGALLSLFLGIGTALTLILVPKVPTPLLLLAGGLIALAMH